MQLRSSQFFFLGGGCAGEGRCSRRRFNLSDMSHESYYCRSSCSLPNCEFLRDYLARVADVTREFQAGNRAPFEGLCKGLTKVLTDERNLFAALKHVERGWGTAVGDDGLKPSDMAEREQWKMVRTTRNHLRKRRYVQGPIRPLNIPKRPGSRETRKIHVQTLRDRYIGRALNQTLGPLLQSRADDCSFSRPGFGPHQAIAHACYFAVQEERTRWIVEDLRDAYGSLPRRDVFDILFKLVPARKVCALAIELAKAPSDRGILQGAAISPWLLNVYLDRKLHAPWRRRFPRTPLLRFADDLVVACRPDEDVHAMYAYLNQLAVSAGFRLKHGPREAIHDIREVEANWLGYLLRRKDGRMSIRPAKYCSDDASATAANLEELRNGFLQLHDQPHGCLSVLDKVIGHVAYLGPCFQDCNRTELGRLIVDAAESVDFDVLGGLDRIEIEWASAHGHFARLAAAVVNDLGHCRAIAPDSSNDPQQGDLPRSHQCVPVPAAVENANELPPWCDPGS